MPSSFPITKRQFYRNRAYVKRRSARRRRRGVLGKIVRKARRRANRRKGFRLMKQIQYKTGYFVCKTVSEAWQWFPTGNAANPTYAVWNQRALDIEPEDQDFWGCFTRYKFYRLRGISIVISALYNTYDSSMPYMKVMSLINRFDDSAPSDGSASYLRWEHGLGYKETYNTRIHKRYIKYPKLAIVDSLAAPTESVALTSIQRSPWIHTSKHDAKYYGWEFCFRTLNAQYFSPNKMGFMYSTKCYWEFKDYDVGV